jgi:hypothetical protein
VKRLALLCTLPALLSFAGAAIAQEEPTPGGGEAADSDSSGTEPKPDANADAGDGDDFGHFMQGGLRAALLGGYRMVFRYDESPYCNEFDPEKSAEDQQKFCGHGSPLAVDTALSFGMLDIFEPFLWARFGLSSEEETDTDPIVILGFGGRFYATADSRFKVFIEPALGFEIEGGGDEFLYRDFDYKKDIVFHVAAGPQYDFARNFGAYAHAGLTTGIFRSIHSTLELALGVQARFP